MDQQPVPEIKQNILSRIKLHKKLIFVTAAVIFLLIFIFFTAFQALKGHFFPSKSIFDQIASLPKPSLNTASMLVKTSKSSYSLSEKIPLRVIASSAGESITAFDVSIEFDPEFLSLTNKKSATLPEFSYFGHNNGTLLQISAVQKPESKPPQIFNNTRLFEFEFTPKKKGRTAFKIVFQPNATNASNLINLESRDILNYATGTEVEIK